MEEALFSIAGVLIGIGVTDYLRRTRRIEEFARAAFEKRLEAYQEAHDLIHRMQDLMLDTVRSTEMTSEQKEVVLQEALMTVAGFFDDNSFLLDERVIVQSVTTMVRGRHLTGEPEDHLEIAIADFNKEVAMTKRLIREDSGITAIHDELRSAAGARLKTHTTEHWTLISKIGK